MIRAHDGRAGCCLNVYTVYTISVNVNSKENACKK